MTEQGLRDVEAGLKDVETFSERQYVNWQNFIEFEEPISKETRTRALRSRKAKYRTKAAAKTARVKPRYAVIRRQIPGISPADQKIVDIKRRTKWKNMTAAQRRRFKALFDKYPRAAILPTLGSPVVRAEAA